jgi:hypothetical protein
MSAAGGKARSRQSLGGKQSQQRGGIKNLMEFTPVKDDAVDRRRSIAVNRQSTLCNQSGAALYNPAADVAAATNRRAPGVSV